MIRVQLLPASFGDCILIEYGAGTDVHRILVDAGLTATYQSALAPRLKKILGAKPVPIDLLVVTHIDRDHIRGILPLLEADPCLVKPAEVWFNGRHHLEDDALGTEEAEALGQLLADRHLPWNAAFGTRAVVVPEAGALPGFEIGGARLTLLSPYREALHQLAEAWDDTLGRWDEQPEPSGEDGGAADDTLGKRPPLDSIDVQCVRDLAEVPFEEDPTLPNGSSIAFLFEYDHKRILFGADAHPSALSRSLKRLSGGPVPLDAFKLSHHGSMNNLSPDLLETVRCPRYLVSSNGSSYGHPHPEALARIAVTPGAKTLCFNYASPYATVWDDATVKEELDYVVKLPKKASEGYVLSL